MPHNSFEYCESMWGGLKKDYGRDQKFPRLSKAKHFFEDLKNIAIETDDQTIKAALQKILDDEIMTQDFVWNRSYRTETEKSEISIVVQVVEEALAEGASYNVAFANAAAEAFIISHSFSSAVQKARRLWKEHNAKFHDGGPTLSNDSGFDRA